MRTTSLFFTFLTTLFGLAVKAQTVEPADVYSTNLEQNMGFESYDPTANKVNGAYFMVLSDGTNSKYVTPAFEVAIYLVPEGQFSKENVMIVKKFPLDGIYHMGSFEWKDQTIDLNKVPNLVPGTTYRLGIWVNSNEAFDEPRDNNAYLFPKPIVFKQYASGGTPSSKMSTEEDEDEDDDWDEEEEEEEEEW
ncbi:MAG: hypothetical protein LPK80_12085 [Bacteroidota bacterium]|nr:hypothetical protein [Bacteroidota bacterium]